MEGSDLSARVLQSTTARVASLVPHPRNYRTHTREQLDHLCRSIEEHGLYRNIVLASDASTILAGHGVVQAAQRLALDVVPVIVVPFDKDDPRALKLLVGDNQIAQLAQIDDRELTEMLKAINESELTELLGTGYDATQLAALVMVTRPTSEIRDHDAAAEWVGLPGYDPQGEKAQFQVVVNCATEEDRASFFEKVGATSAHVFAGSKSTRSIWWPLRERERSAEVFDQ